jgi:hypothetical protein
MHHTTLSVCNISTLHHLASSNPSSFVIDNGSSLPITSVGDSILPGPFYLNNILIAPDMVQSLLSVHHFTPINLQVKLADDLGPPIAVASQF